MAFSEKFPRTNDGVETVNYLCQRCSHPLKLHPSFDNVDERTFHEITTPSFMDANHFGSSSVEAFKKTVESGDVSRKLILPGRLPENDQSFLVVESMADSANSHGKNMYVSSTLFDLLSDQSDIDHPICETCTDNLLDQMDQLLKVAEDECKEYREFLEHLEVEDDKKNLEMLEEELSLLKIKEEELKASLSEVEEKVKVAKDVLTECEEEQQRIQREDDRYWQEYSNLKNQCLQCEDDLISIENQLCYSQAQLDKLNKTNIFNATFHIWHVGHFATINNFRLGRLPTVPVEWSEINAAWGQAVLLLHSLAKKIGLVFERYRLVPYGNHSYLEALGDKPKMLPLYCYGGFKFWGDTKFDQAMVGFLDCLQQFKERVEDGDPSLVLPHRIGKGKIADSKNRSTYSVRIQLNSEEHWTKALKFMLTNLKWAIAWVSSQYKSS